MSADVETREVERILASPKYRSLARETIEDVLGRELRRHGPGPRAIRSARTILHRVAAYYLGQPDYGRVEEALSACADRDARNGICRSVLQGHGSTRERLEVMVELYAGIFGRTGIPTRLADLASACNPFAFPWMGLPDTVRYDAYDINADMVRLVGRYFELEGIPGRAIHRDVLCRPPTEVYDTALLLKMYHCLEHRRRGAGWEVVAATPARVVAVSFPSRNLRGRVADIAGNYRDEILGATRAAGWSCEEVTYPGETVFLVTKAVA